MEYDAFVVGGDCQRSRLDVLGLDEDGRLVVAELKRGIAPDTVDMQVIKYAAMVSRFRLKTLAAAHAVFLAARGTAITDEQAGEALLAHAELMSDETLANPKVVIIAQGFSPIVISSAVWLAQQGVDLHAKSGSSRTSTPRPGVRHLLDVVSAAGHREVAGGAGDSERGDPHREAAAGRLV